MTKADHIAGVVAEKDAEIERLKAERDEWKATAETVSMLRDKAIEAATDAIKTASRELLDVLDQGGLPEQYQVARMKLRALIGWMPAPSPE